MDCGFCVRNNEKETDARDIIVSVIMQIIQWGIEQKILMIRAFQFLPLMALISVVYSEYEDL